MPPTPLIREPLPPPKDRVPLGKSHLRLQTVLPRRAVLGVHLPSVSSKVPQFQLLPPKPPPPLPSKAGCPVGNGGYEEGTL